jgi:hypothetical protein
MPTRKTMGKRPRVYVDEGLFSVRNAA